MAVIYYMYYGTGVEATVKTEALLSYTLYSTVPAQRADSLNGPDKCWEYVRMPSPREEDIGTGLSRCSVRRKLAPVRRRKDQPNQNPESGQMMGYFGNMAPSNQQHLTG